MAVKPLSVVKRPWQDVVFAIGEVVFIASLIPMFFKGTPVPLASGIGTGFMLYTFMAAHISYRNWITVAITFVTATIWVALGLGLHL